MKTTRDRVLRKRSFAIAGHRTSIALEPEFWIALEKIADEQKTTLPRLIETIDKTRKQDRALASAIRVEILRRFMHRVVA